MCFFAKLSQFAPSKPLNVWDLKRDIVYKNDEMYNLMRALDIEDNIEHLRYDKVFLAAASAWRWKSQP